MSWLRSRLLPAGLGLAVCIVYALNTFVVRENGPYLPHLAEIKMEVSETVTIAFEITNNTEMYHEVSTRVGKFNSSDELPILKIVHEHMNSKIKKDNHYKEMDKTLIAVMQSRDFLVFSNSCQLPDIDPRDISIRRYLAPSEPTRCSDAPLLTKIKKDDQGRSVLILNRSHIGKYTQKHGAESAKVVCCFSVVKRVQPTERGIGADNQYNIGHCLPLQDSAVLGNEVEFVLVRCKSANLAIYTHMHTIPSLEPVKKAGIEPMKNRSRTMPLSVLMIGYDSISRLSMIRTMPRTVEHMTRTGWLEIKGYNKVADNTFPNVMAILTGQSLNLLSKTCYPNRTTNLDECPLIWKEFANRGYATVYMEDEPEFSTFNYLKAGFFNKPTDYYLRPYIQVAEAKLKKRIRYSMAICLGPSSTTDHILGYTSHLLKEINNIPVFTLIWLNNFSHNNLNSPGSMDGRSLQFLEELRDSNILDNTIVFFISDHGIRFGEFRETHIGWMEERLPFFYIWLPPWFKYKFPEKWTALQENTHRLTSPYDLHETLRELLPEPKTSDEYNRTRACPKCQSLFKPVPLERSCADAGITEHWCACETSSPMSLDDPIALELAHETLKHVQSILTAAGRAAKKCAKLSLARVIKARKKLSSSYTGSSVYTIMIEAKPGGAKLDATVRKITPTSEYQILGEVSRINSYSKESQCVKDSTLRLYCHCI